MSTPEEFPGGIDQTRNALKSYDKLKQVEQPVGVLTEGIVAGYLTLTPASVESSGFLKDPQRIVTLDRLLAYQVFLNDRLDFTHAGKPELSDLIDEARQNESRAKIRLDESLCKLNSPEITARVENALAEVEYVEHYFNLHKVDPSFDDIEKYRNIVNAINNVVASSIIYGGNSFPQRHLSEPLETLSWETVYDKYRWVLDEREANMDDVQERAVVISHNMAMAAQVDDDWKGQYIDRPLHVESFATGAMREAKNDTEEAEQFLNGVKQDYISKARKLGLGIVPAVGFNAMQSVLQSGMSKVTKGARYSEHPRLKEYFKKKVQYLGMREKAYANERL